MYTPCTYLQLEGWTVELVIRNPSLGLERAYSYHTYLFTNIILHILTLLIGTITPSVTWSIPRAAPGSRGCVRSSTPRGCTTRAYHSMSIWSYIWSYLYCSTSYHDQVRYECTSTRIPTTTGSHDRTCISYEYEYSPLFLPDWAPSTSINYKIYTLYSRRLRHLDGPLTAMNQWTNEAMKVYIRTWRLVVLGSWTVKRQSLPGYRWAGGYRYDTIILNSDKPKT